MSGPLPEPAPPDPASGSANPPTIIIHKRPRGRPRKYPRPGDPIIVYIPEPHPKSERQRGRPRKNPPTERRDLNFDSIVLGASDDVHYKLEVLEHRIQVGDDSVHDHPAMSVSILTEFGVRALTYREKKLKTHYALQAMSEPRPSFWEKREWDERDMTEEESEKLKARMEELKRESSEIRKKEEKATKKKTKREARRKRARRYWSSDDDEDEWDSEEEDEWEERREPSASLVRRTQVRTRSAGPPQEWTEDGPILVRISSRAFGTDDSDGTDVGDFAC